MEKIKYGPESLIYPMPAVLIGAVVNNKPNFITIAWSGTVCSKPSMISVGIRPERYTLKGIMEHKVFSLNVPSVDNVKEVDYCGINSGNKTDKSEIFEVFYGENKNIPLIEEFPINMECRLVHTIELGTHILIIGEVIETHVSKDCIADDIIEAVKINPIIYSTKERNYYAIGKKIGKAWSIGKEYKK